MLERWVTGLVLIGVVAGPTVVRADVFPGATWQTASPASQQMDSTALDAAMAYLESVSGPSGTTQAMVIRNGYLVWSGSNVNSVHNVWSMTKSFTSTTLGLLVDDGSCTLDSLAATYVPDMASLYPDVTLRHMATMTSGYDAGGSGSSTPFDPTAPLFVPGEFFAYWDSAMNQLANVLTEIADQRIEDLFEERIADPIGMSQFGWSWDQFRPENYWGVNGGAGNMGRGVKINAIEAARMGLLFLNRGNWDGTQLISEAWIDEATSVQVAASVPEFPNNPLSPDGPGTYGLNWWVNGIKPNGERFWPGAPTGTYQAIGHNNNRIVVIPEWNMVVVRLGADGALVDHDEFSTFVAMLEESALFANLHRGVVPDDLDAHLLDIDSPCVEDAPGTLSDGQTYYYLVEDHGGPPSQVTVEAASVNDAVRVCFL